jgi:hypothetical protein
LHLDNNGVEMQETKAWESALTQLAMDGTHVLDD